MPILTADQYIRNRQNYNYNAPGCRLEINQTGNLSNDMVGVFNGIYSHGDGFTLRKLESVIRSVFEDCRRVGNKKMGDDHIGNLKSIVSTVAHWKNYSQGGRGAIKRDNVSSKWSVGVAYGIMDAYRAYLTMQNSTIKLFEIPGYKIPTASALIRFIFPERYGIVDSRIVNNLTYPPELTAFNVRQNDGYINPVNHNRTQYDTAYTGYLRQEAEWLNSQGVTFVDADSYVQGNHTWRPCDIEMALWDN